MAGWLLKKFLMSLYKIFDRAPGRHTEYKKVANAVDKDFPVPFVSHRWIENKQVAKKTVWLTIIDYWKELPKSKQPSSGKPGAIVSYDCLCAALNDPVIPLKLLLSINLQGN